MSEQSKELKEELNAQNKYSFLHHPYTQEFLQKLNNDRNDLLKKAENLSISSPRDVDSIITNLVKAKQIRETIEYVNVIRQ